MNTLSRDERLLILKLMCRSSCIRDIVEITGHSPNTIRRHLAWFGEACIAIHDRHVRGVSPRRIEVDEQWSYVYAKRERNISQDPEARKPPEDRGEHYTWVAFDPDSKLYISWMIGDRSAVTGVPFLTDLYTRIVGHTLITTDGFPFYAKAIKDIFTTTAEHVTIEKVIESWRNPETGERGTRVKSFEKIPQTRGPIDMRLASTSLVERFNASTRNFMSRFTRQTYKFSKRLTAHIHAMAIYAVYYNFTKEHLGFKGPERHFTPAMKAGLTDKVWEFEDLLDKIEQYWERKAQQPALQVIPSRPFVPLKPGERSSLPWFVMYSPKKREAKLHRCHCRNCQHGHGRKKESSYNEWYAFATEREARRCAQMLAPLDYSDCAICVTGHYVRHYVRSKRSRS